MRRQKGQAVVEFALVLPLFLLVLFGIIYSGMLFYDYSSLSNLARSGAREAAITQNLSSDKITDIQSHYKTKTGELLTNLYTADTTDPFTVSHDTGEGSVKVTIKMNLTTSSPLMRMVLPDSYEIEYYMKRDQSSQSDN